MRRITLLATLALLALATVATFALTSAGGAPNTAAKTSPTPVFDLNLVPGKEVPAVTGLKARARGHVTFDLTRDAAGRITQGDVVFYFNYRFPRSVDFTGLHIHRGVRTVSGPVVIDSGLTAFTDGDSDGNITVVATDVRPAVLQAILNNPSRYYVNLHTSVHPAGAVRDQLRLPKAL